AGTPRCAPTRAGRGAATARRPAAAPPRDRARIRSERAPWLDAAPAEGARRYREDEITVHDVIRRYGVVLDWGTGELLEKSTGQFRESMRARPAAHWSGWLPTVRHGRPGADGPGPAIAGAPSRSAS